MGRRDRETEGWGGGGNQKPRRASPSFSPTLIPPFSRLPLRLANPSRDFVGIRAGVESADAEVAFAGGAEAAAGGDDDVQLLEHAVEHLPARAAGGGFDPDVGGVHAAPDGEAG